MKDFLPLPDPDFHNHAGERYKTADQKAAEERAYVIAAHYPKMTANDAMTRIYDSTKLREIFAVQEPV